MAREADVLKALGRSWLRPSEIARRLNFDGPCPWCPVLPPKPGEKCDVVPRASAARVQRVLDRLVAVGGVVRDTVTSRTALYHIPNGRH